MTMQAVAAISKALRPPDASVYFSLTVTNHTGKPKPIRSPSVDAGFQKGESACRRQLMAPESDRPKSSPIVHVLAVGPWASVFSSLKWDKLHSCCKDLMRYLHNTFGRPFGNKESSGSLLKLQL